MRQGSAAFLGWISLLLCCLLGSGAEASAEETMKQSENGAFLSLTEDTQVTFVPGTAQETAIGSLSAGQPALAYGRQDGWIQIYYRGMIGYIPETAAGAYTPPAAPAPFPLPLRDGLVINALGDSITYGDKLSDTGLAFPYVVASGCMEAKLNNYGWNGSNLAGPHPDRLVDRYPAMEPDADLILVLGGTNDYAGFHELGTPLGTAQDTTADTFYGGLNLLMCGLRQMYPDRDVVFMTPLRRVGYMRKNGSGFYLNQYAEAIRERAAFWGFRVIDLFNEPELDFSSRSAAYLVDGLHPNEKGHALVGACVYRRLFKEP